MRKRPGRIDFAEGIGSKRADSQDLADKTVSGRVLILNDCLRIGHKLNA